MDSTLAARRDCRPATGQQEAAAAPALRSSPVSWSSEESLREGDGNEQRLITVLAVGTGVVVIVVAVALVLVVLFVTVSMRGRQKRAAQRRGEARRDLD